MCSSAQATARSFCGRKRKIEPWFSTTISGGACAACSVGELPEYDFLYSLIVLQHNSPPIQAFLLDVLLANVRSGGAVLFQTATNIPGYAFHAADYLQSEDATMELHALPQSKIMSLLRIHGLEVQEVLMDPFLGLYGSNTFFATKA